MKERKLVGGCLLKDIKGFWFRCRVDLCVWHSIGRTFVDYVFHIYQESERLMNAV